ncbi:MAG: helix-turn-helix domain-containing protein [Deltaproteobacteria bacterium]|nr:helix-turn-helix domain-containing protein [Deltaproteobacteria bacterium]
MPESSCPIARPREPRRLRKAIQFPPPSEKNLFSRVIDSFQQAVRLKVRLIPLKEKGYFNPTHKHSHCFCKVIQGSSLGKRRCLQEIKRATKLAAKLGEPYIFQCHANMIEFTAAIYNDGQAAYALTCGPILLRQADPSFKKDTLAKVQDLPLEKSWLMQFLGEIPVMSERRVQAAADILFMMANYFTKSDGVAEKQKREIASQQAQLAEKLYLKKKIEKSLGKLSPHSFFPWEDFSREKELVELIKRGDRKRAKALLDELLGDLLFRSHEHIGILKARMLELIVIMARAAVEMGAHLEEILGFKYHFFQDLSKDDSQENLYFCLLKAFDQLFERIYQNRNIQHTRIFIKAKEFIWSNYNQDISLKKLAGAVGISPYYLSRLFRKEMEITFLDYVKSVRHSIAKKLLEQTTQSILEVCLEVGYQDPSYFSKVFREREGVNPAEYRKKLNIA